MFHHVIMYYYELFKSHRFSYQIVCSGACVFICLHVCICLIPDIVDYESLDFYIEKGSIFK